jgi:hypothetical protein
MKTISVASDAKPLAFTSALTFAEFLTVSPIYRTLIRQRAAEVRLPVQDQDYFVHYPDMTYFIALVTPDDPDTVAVLPILAAIADASPRFELRIVCDEDDLTLLDALVDDLDLIDGLDDLDLPLLSVLDEEWAYQAHWGPRPASADAYVDTWLERHPEYERLADEESDEDQAIFAALLEKLTCEMRVWYNTSLNGDCAHEIRTLLADLQGETSEPEKERN